MKTGIKFLIAGCAILLFLCTCCGLTSLIIPMFGGNTLIQIIDEFIDESISIPDSDLPTPNYPDDVGNIVIAPLSEPVTVDSISIESMSVKDDVLYIEVTYGGCGDHDFILYLNDSVEIGLYGEPMIVFGELVHDAHGDGCFMSNSDTLPFDLDEIREQLSYTWFNLEIADSEGNITSLEVELSDYETDELREDAESISFEEIYQGDAYGFWDSTDDYKYTSLVVNE